MDKLPRTASEYRLWWIEQRPNIPYGQCWCGCGRATNLAKRDWPAGLRFDGEPFRWRRGHALRKPQGQRAPRKPPRKRPEKRTFEYEVEDRGYDTPCHIWRGYVNKQGYGQVRRDGRYRNVHRWHYEQQNGPLPDDIVLHHLCPQKSCIRLSHLVPLTRSQHAATHANDPRSARSDQKLTAAKVIDMRRIRAEEGLSYSRLADMFGVHEGTVGKIIARERWRSLP